MECNYKWKQKAGSEAFAFRPKEGHTVYRGQRAKLAGGQEAERTH